MKNKQKNIEDRILRIATARINPGQGSTAATYIRERLEDVILKM